MTTKHADLHAASGQAPAGRVYGLALFATAVVLCLPVALTQFPPLADYPNHLARAYILHSYDSSAFFQSLFLRSFEPTPNVACDVIMVLLMNVLPAEAAGHAFLVLLVLAFVAGCHLLGRGIHRHTTWLAIPASFLVYSSTFFSGFINYVLGVALFCIAFGLWLDWRTRWSPAKYVSLIALVLAAYLAHLTAYAFLGIACVIVEGLDLLRSRTQPRAAFVALLPLAPPLIAFVAFMNGGGSVGKVMWSTLAGKVAGAASPILSYSYLIDIAVVIALLAVAIVTARTARVRVWTHTFVAGAVFVAIFLMAPVTLLTASAVDVRFVLPGVLLLLLSLRIDVPRYAGRNLFICAVFTFCVRLGAVTREWGTSSGRARTQVRALAAVRSNASIYPVFVAVKDRNEKHVRGLTQIAHYATIRRNAFVPSLFAFRGQQPLIFRDASRYFRATERIPMQKPPADLAQFDYLWAYGLTAEAKLALAPLCTTLEDSDGFLLCEVRRTLTP